MLPSLSVPTYSFTSGWGFIQHLSLSPWILLLKFNAFFFVCFDDSKKDEITQSSNSFPWFSYEIGIISWFVFFIDVMLDPWWKSFALCANTSEVMMWVELQVSFRQWAEGNWKLQTFTLNLLAIQCWFLPGPQLGNPLFMCVVCFYFFHQCLLFGGVRPCVATTFCYYVFFAYSFVTTSHEFLFP